MSDSTHSSSVASSDDLSCSFLTADELEQVKDNPTLIIKKAQEYINKKEEELLECREEVKTARLANESMLNKFEQQQSGKTEEYELLKERIEYFKGESKTYQEQIEHLNKQVKDTEKRYYDQRIELEQLNTLNEELKSEKSRYLSSIEKKNKEIEEMNSTFQFLQVDISSHNRPH